jgi:hypothetical protein
MASPITRHLARLSRSVALPTLKQGGTLSFRSTFPNVVVHIKPEWRDEGNATLLQQFGDKDGMTVAEMIVSEEADKMTSLGRSESHVSILLQESRNLDQRLPPKGRMDHVEYHDGTAKVEAWFSSSDKEKADLDQSTPENSVTLTVPEKVNIVCELEEKGSIQVASKVEGDVKLLTTNGDIRVKKLRGHSVDLETKHQNTIIYASDLLEAYTLKLTTQGGRLRAKRIHGDSVDIRVFSPKLNDSDHKENATDPLDDDDEGSLVDLSSMYVSGAGGAQVTLEEGLAPEKRAVRIKSHHGPVLVDVSGVHKPRQINDNSGESVHFPLVELGSVNGSCEVSIRDIPERQVGSWAACQVHYDSISPDSISLLSTEAGDISLTMDRKLEADLRLFSTANKESLEEISTILAEEDESEVVKDAVSKVEDTYDGSKVAISQDESQPRISVETQSFTETEHYVSPSLFTQYIEGWVENRSKEPDSRFEMKTRGEAGVQSMGKIRLEGAADQALKHFSTPQKGDVKDVALPANRPLIVASTAGNISLETLSWLGAIARRYGLDEKGRDLGRQATRRGRTVLPADE